MKLHSGVEATSFCDKDCIWYVGILSKSGPSVVKFSGIRLYLCWCKFRFGVDRYSVKGGLLKGCAG